ncbi:MAG TPA: CrcB family protein [Pseudolysinimonas sp.]|nr:CrcB family protein [Pseudolysinimonas sp.]
MTVVAVLAGGMIGTGLRLGIDALLPHGDADFPLSTLLINVAGSFALGLLVARVWPSAPAWLRAGLGTGVLGSFTTFSAVIASVAVLSLAGRPLVAAAYLALSLVVGLAAAWAGLRLGSRRPPLDPAVDE